MNTDDIYKIKFIQSFEKIEAGSEFEVKNSQVLYSTNGKLRKPKRWLEYVISKKKVRVYIRVRAGHGEAKNRQSTSEISESWPLHVVHG